ncbi:unannotated protein [freshwater metagenome]|uniref:Unannotated protein n=1 Tax=freshwater metagenome TaxID=449393 RepID=A0A6J7S7V5_9ZZZZ|nr:DUF4870 domain-containing protein [Actinomycetota bacterium]MSW35875.1 DUF4870 domain-containing protein [Actinomycetota bacterium]MSX37815.1 DUF4870 domain-containing protein [Actinomycetota bacterium]
MSEQVPQDPSRDFSTPTPPPPPAPAPPAGAYAGAPTGAEVPLRQDEERMWAMLSHVGGIVVGFLAGLIVMLVFGKRSAFVNDQAKEALNFQITLAIGWVAALILSAVFIGFLLYPVLAIADLVFSIIAGIAANKGEIYRYPVCLRLVK